MKLYFYSLCYLTIYKKVCEQLKRNLFYELRCLKKMLTHIYGEFVLHELLQGSKDHMEKNFENVLTMMMDKWKIFEDKIREKLLIFRE